MKTKLGIATSIRFSAEKPHIRGTKLKNSAILKTPNRYPIKPYVMATPPRMKPTGYPINKSTPIVKNINIGKYSTIISTKSITAPIPLDYYLI